MKILPAETLRPYAAFESRPFRRYQLSRFLSVLGSQMTAVAVGWQVYALTEDPLYLGLVGLVQFIPNLALWPLTGQVADHFDRRRIVNTCLFGYFLGALLLLYLTRFPVVWPILVALVFWSVPRAFSAPASQAMLPSLVPRPDFPNAVTWSSTLFHLGAVLGPAAGGALYAAGGAPLVYATSAGLLLTATLVMLGVHPTPSALPPGRMSADPALLWEGVRYVRRQPVLLGAISLDLFAVLLGGAVALLPMFAKDILATGPTGLGLLRGAPAAGATVMAVWLSYRPIQRRAGRALFTAVALFGVATIIFGLSRSFYLSLAMLFLVGATDEVSVVIRQTVIQLATPDHMRGRVSAVNFLFIGVSNEIGELESGIAAKLLGAVRAVVLGGIGTLAVVGLWPRFFPKLWGVDSLKEELGEKDG